MANLYQKVFTGEIPPLIINRDTPTNKPFTPIGATEPSTYKELSILRWRDIAKLHLPSNAKLENAEFEFKLEYLQMDFEVPSVTVVPSQLLPIYSPADTDAQTQVKTAELRNKFNRDTGHALEMRLLRCYDPNYQLNRNFPDSYAGNTSYDVNLKYPINELLYNNRLPGFFDLMPYLIKNGNLIFTDIRQELKMQIIPNLGASDVIVITGGYTGSVMYEEKEAFYETQTTVSESRTIGLTPEQILPRNNNRFSFYISNNSGGEMYFSFGESAPSLSLKLTLKPQQTLVYEHGEIYIEGQRYVLANDNRVRLGCPVWVRSAAIANALLSIEELSFVEVGG